MPKTHVELFTKIDAMTRESVGRSLLMVAKEAIENFENAMRDGEICEGHSGQIGIRLKYDDVSIQFNIREKDTLTEAGLLQRYIWAQEEHVVEVSGEQEKKVLH
jgi:hypothetical protein